MHIEALRTEPDNLIHECNEHAERLLGARVQLDELLGAAESDEAEVKA